MAKKPPGRKPPLKRAPRVKPEAQTLPVLNFRQSQFVAFYLGEANGNATEAARMAGYPHPNVSCSRLLANISIQTAIAAKLAGPAMRASEVLSRLTDMASVDMADFVTVKGKSVQIDIPKAIKAGKSHLIKKLKDTEFGLAIELHDSQAALEKLGRYHALFKDKFTPPDDEERGKTRDALEQKLAGFANSSPGEVAP